jgi:hypothetical protein
MFKHTIISLIFLFLTASICRSEEHWAIGGWDCRHWGSIKVLKNKYVIDLDPEGKVQDVGFWQDYDQHSIVIIWSDSYRIEIINKHYGKFYRQVMIEGFGIVSNVEEVQKLNNGEDE